MPEPAEVEPAPPSPTGLRRLVLGAERLAVAHVASYPIAFLWAISAIPLAIHVYLDDIDRLSGDTQIAGRFVVGKLAWPAGAAFVIAHALGIPWALARDARRWQRRCLVGLAIEAALGVAFGAASWGWLLSR